MKINTFYDLFHKKSGVTKKIIDSNSFTYFYIIKSLHFPLLNLRKKCKILDIGCGVGTISFYLAKNNAEVIGVDISKKAISFANKSAKILGIDNVHFICGTIDRVAKKRFDVVVCTEVLEHIDNDKMFINTISSILQKNGYLILSTPIKEIFLYKYHFYDNFDKSVGHLRRYDVSELRRLLEKNKLKVVSVTRVESVLRSILFTTRLKKVSKYIFFARLLNAFDGFLGKFLGFSNVIILAKKI